MTVESVLKHANVCISFVNASNIGKNSNGYERKESNNYGINKKYQITDGNRDYIINTPYVNAKNKIYDFVDILSEEDEKYLKPLIDGFIKETGLDFVFVSIDMPYTDDSDNENYGMDFYDFNDFGLDNDKYGGILLLRNNYQVDPYYTVVLTGEAQLYCSTSELDHLLDRFQVNYIKKELKCSCMHFHLCMIEVMMKKYIILMKMVF